MQARIPPGSNEPAVRSPLSDRPPQPLRELPRDFLLAELGRYFHAAAPADVVESDYSMWRCADTGLEYCVPRRPGNAAFYEWISHFPYYYPGTRWEYGQVATLVREARLQSDGKILDVGAGEGDFLQTLDFLPASSRFALDMNAPAISACRAKGINAFCGTIDAALAQGFLRPGEFAAVTSFHCLEHVDEPVEFVRGLVQVTAPGGRIFLSTPASPMSFEGEWFDVLNHPPHHLTRWNLAAYQRLAGILGVQMRHFFPPTRTLSQAVQLFCLKRYGPNVKVARGVLLRDLVRHAGQFLGDWHRLRARARSHELRGSDVILVEFVVPR